LIVQHLLLYSKAVGLLSLKMSTVIELVFEFETYLVACIMKQRVEKNKIF
jgi:hypothetical protein